MNRVLIFTDSGHTIAIMVKQEGDFAGLRQAFLDKRRGDLPEGDPRVMIDFAHVVAVQIDKDVPDL